jgi:hypothetical protein
VITMSALPRLINCPSSEVLPRAETMSQWADAGNDEHEELADLASLPPELAKLVPAGARSEVKIAYDVATRTARIIGDGGGRDYGAVAPFEIPGSIDVLGVDGDSVVIIDWKTGFNEVDPAASNWQLWGYALAACRALGKHSAIVRIVYTRTGIIDSHEIDALELAEFADKLAALHVRVAALQTARSSGELLSTREGSWCKHCPSKHVCPSKNALLVQLGSKGLATVGDAEMTPERALAAHVEIERIDQLLKDAKGRRLAYIDANGPIDLGNGKFYGRYVRRGDERLDGAVAARAIAEIVGESAKEFAEVALERKTSKAALTRAAKAIGQPPKLATAVVKRIRELDGSKRAPDELPVGEFTPSVVEIAPPIDADEVNRLLEGA